MKKFVFTLIAAVLTASGYTQDFSQFGTQADVSIDGQTYHVTSLGYRLMINNLANLKSDEYLVWNDGKILDEDEYVSLKLGEVDVSTFYQAIRETFSEEEFNLLKEGNDRIEVLLTNTPDGRVIEVDFYIRISPRILALFPNRTKIFEDNIKKYIRYTPGEDAQRLPFWRSFHQINFGDLGFLYINKTRPDPYFEGEAID